MTFFTVREEYQAYLTGRGLKEGTVSRKIGTLATFQRLIDKDLRDTEERDFIDYAHYLEEEELSPGTRGQYVSNLRQFFVWLYKNDLLLENKADLIPSIQIISREKPIFTVEEINRFLETIDMIRDHAFFELLYSSGLRCNEALNLRWKDIFLTSRKLRVNQGKGGRDRFVPFSKTAGKYLIRWKKQSTGRKEDFLFPGIYGGHLVYGSIKARFRKYLKEADIEREGLSIHSIRHSTATHLLEAGAGVRYVSDLLGHSSMDTTIRYTHPSEESLKRTFRMHHPRENGIYRELDEEYQAELKTLRAKFREREEHVTRYGTGH